MALSLTRRQAELLRFVAGYQAAKGGVSPCFRECAAAIGTSKSMVHRHLQALRQHGAIRLPYGKHRAIEIIVPVSVPSIDGAPLFAVPLRPTRRVAYSGERL